jgi:hypothetical protein
LNKLADHSFPSSPNSEPRWWPTKKRVSSVTSASGCSPLYPSPAPPVAALRLPTLLLPFSMFLFDDFLLSGLWRITCGPALPLPSPKTCSLHATASSDLLHRPHLRSRFPVQQTLSAAPTISLLPSFGVAFTDSFNTNHGRRVTLPKTLAFGVSRNPFTRGSFGSQDRLRFSFDFDHFNCS